LCQHDYLPFSQLFYFCSPEAYHILEKIKKTRLWAASFEVQGCCFPFSAGNNLLRTRGGDGVGKKEKAKKSLLLRHNAGMIAPGCRCVKKTAAVLTADRQW
jgi:hypothetical protein